MQTLILNHYPPVIKQIREIRQIAKAEDIEFSKLNASIKEIIKNMFVFTANEIGVQRFEKLLGIKPKPTQGLDDRKLYIFLMLNRRKMSLHEILKLLSEYTKGISLNLDYEKYELTMESDDSATNTGMLLKVLDEIMPLQIYIYFKMETVMVTKFGELTGELDMETTAKWKSTSEEWYFDGTVPLDGSRLLNAYALDVWRLDGTVLLDGSKLLGDFSSKRLTIVEIELENTMITIGDIFNGTELTEQRNLWYLDGTVPLDGSRIMNAEIHKEVI